MSREHDVHGGFFDPAALLDHAIVHAALDFEEHGRLGRFIVEPQAKLEAAWCRLDNRLFPSELWGKIWPSKTLGTIFVPDADL
jgi:hypothetical protein